jgi:predicted dienelactone hydrolase
MRRLLPVVAFALLTHSAGADIARFESSGPYNSEVWDTRWFDVTRQRAVPLRVRAPIDAGATETRRPIIVFTHGLAGSLDTGRLWGEHWASHGFIVIHVQHPGSDEAAVANSKSPRAAMRKASNGTQFVQRLRDLRFVFDELERLGQTRNHGEIVAAEEERPARVRLAQAGDFARIGLAGHSMGATTVQRLAGQNHTGPKANGPGDDYEPRAAAFVAFSPSARNPQAAVQFAHIEKPFFSITGTLDGRGPSRLGVPAKNRVVPFEGMRGDNKYLLNLDGAGHMVFAGSPRKNASAQDKVRDFEHVRITRTLTTAFWFAYLMDDADAHAGIEAGENYVGSAGAFRSK